MNWVIVSHSAAKVAARGDGMIVAYDYSTLQKTNLPERVRAAIETLEHRKGAQE